MQTGCRRRIGKTRVDGRGAGDEEVKSKLMGCAGQAVQTMESGGRVGGGRTKSAGWRAGGLAASEGGQA